jgi:uncharacterized protein (DUF1800 family)
MIRKTVFSLVVLAASISCTAPNELVYPWAPLAQSEMASQRTTARAIEKPITEDEARHLLRRTGFGIATPAEVVALVSNGSLDYEGAVDALLDGMRTKPSSPLLGWFDEKPQRGRDVRELPIADQEAYKNLWLKRRRTVRHWWLGEMLTTPSPLTERMTLFWHGHFTSSVNKVKYATLMYEQNALFRREAIGNFARLLRAVSKGPAMLIYLDNRDNKAGHPNENFARELLELFTLGEGQSYTERDIREAARALTGWRVDIARAAFDMNQKVHDDGTKTFLGETGRFDGDDIVGIVLKQRRTADYITERLWRAFVDDAPDRSEVARLADNFRRSGYEIRPLLKGLLMTPRFRAAANRGLLVKSPIDLGVGTYRLIGAAPDNMKRFEGALRRMGQDVFNPPNVKGWPGGKSWINSTTLSLRQQFLRKVWRDARRAARDDTMAPPTATAMMAAGGDDMMNPAMTPAMKPRVAGSGRSLYASLGRMRGAPEVLDDVMLAVPAIATANLERRPDRRLLQLLQDPAFQLK